MTKSSKYENPAKNFEEREKEIRGRLEAQELLNGKAIKLRDQIAKKIYDILRTERPNGPLYIGSETRAHYADTISERIQNIKNLISPENILRATRRMIEETIDWSHHGIGEEEAQKITDEIITAISTTRT
jgi:hypothetical protein